MAAREAYSDGRVAAGGRAAQTEVQAIVSSHVERAVEGRRTPQMGPYHRSSGPRASWSRRGHSAGRRIGFVVG